jgi:hypothetical protein
MMQRRSRKRDGISVPFFCVGGSPIGSKSEKLKASMFSALPPTTDITKHEHHV